MKYLICLFILLFSSNFLHGQYYENEPYSKKYFGTLSTKRNYPIPHSKADSIIVPCRKLIKADDIFYEPNHMQDISIALKKTISQLTEADKVDVFINAWHTRDTGLFRIVLHSALYDTGQNMRISRDCSIKCLSRYNNNESKKALVEILTDKDKDFAMLGALSLAQLGEMEIAFQYIKQHYTDFDIRSDIHTALMLINTKESIELLFKMTENPDPSNALDALAALSLMGYCDFAFNRFKQYVNNPNETVRTDVAWCLAYYIGTPEAFGIIEGMRNDVDYFLNFNIDNILKIYKIKN